MFNYMVPTIAVSNQKGGVGKTTVASILAEYAGIVRKLRVLVIDLDMQCNSSDYFVGMDIDSRAVGGQLPPEHQDYDGDPSWNIRSSIADTFYGQEFVPYETFVCAENGYQGTVDIAMGHPERLERINTEFDNKSGKIDSNVVSRIGEIIHTEALQQIYDLVILDTGPSRNPIFRSALRAATHIVIPFEPEEKSIQGINAMIQAIQSENFQRRPGDELRLVGLLPNKVRINTNLHREALNSLHEYLGEKMFSEETYLPQSTAFPERDVKGINPKSIFNINANHKARIYSERVANYVLNCIFGEAEQQIPREVAHEEIA